MRGDSLSAVRIDTPARRRRSLTALGQRRHRRPGDHRRGHHRGNLVFTPAANANGSRATPTSPSACATHGGRRIDAAPNTLTSNVTAVNDAPTGTDNTVTTDEDTRLHLQRPPTSASATSTAGDALSAVRIDTLPAAGTLELCRGQPVTAGRGDHGRRHHQRQPGVHTGHQRQRRPLHQPHLPGARRRRPAVSTAVAQHAHLECHRGQRCAHRHRQLRSSPTRTPPTRSPPPTSASATWTRATP